MMLYVRKSHAQSPEELLKEKAAARRPWWWMAGVLSVLFLILGCVLFLDVPEPDDASMLPEFTPGGGPRNDLVVFLEEAKRQAPRGLKLPAQGVKNVDLDKIEEAREHLVENSELLNLYDGLIKTDHSKWRLPKERDVQLSQKQNYAKLCIDISNLVVMRIRYLAREGKTDAAFNEVLNAIHFSHSLSKSEGDLLDWASAMMCHQMAMGSLEKLLAQSQVDEIKLKAYQEALAMHGCDKSDFILTLKTEYLIYKNYGEAFKAGKIPAPPIGVGIPRWAGLTYRPNHALQMTLDLNGPIVIALSKDWAAGVNEMNIVNEKIFGMYKRSWRSLINEYRGDDFVLGTESVKIMVGSRTVQNVAVFRQTLIIIAMRRFELAYGKLPSHLEELVPQYLEEVPSDPFDNKPMRWNIHENVVYSVNKDLKDDGGKVSRPWKPSNNDVGLHYFWKPETVEKK